MTSIAATAVVVAASHGQLSTTLAEEVVVLLKRFGASEAIRASAYLYSSRAPTDWVMRCKK